MKRWCFILTQTALIALIVPAIAEDMKQVMKLASRNFENQQEIPKKHTCDGGDISPALAWSDVPDGTKSFVLIVDDPDAPDPANPRMTWVHWVLYNIPANASFLPEGAKEEDLPKGALQA
jgi:hypothetical protein